MFVESNQEKNYTKNDKLFPILCKKSNSWEVKVNKYLILLVFFKYFVLIIYWKLLLFYEVVNCLL